MPVTWTTRKHSTNQLYLTLWDRYTFVVGDSFMAVYEGEGTVPIDMREWPRHISRNGQPGRSYARPQTVEELSACAWAWMSTWKQNA
jgi:hypothetical protein